MIVNLLDDEIDIATKETRKYLEYIVDNIVSNQNLKEDQIRIIWKGLEAFAHQALKEKK